jgi:hypothetical protein
MLDSITAIYNRVFLIQIMIVKGQISLSGEINKRKGKLVRTNLKWGYGN